MSIRDQTVVHSRMDQGEAQVGPLLTEELLALDGCQERVTFLWEYGHLQVVYVNSPIPICTWLAVIRHSEMMMMMINTIIKYIFINN